MAKQKIITICSSATFYKHAYELMQKLEKAGYKVIIPSTALKMQESGNYDPMHYKTWYENPDDFHIKRQRMDGHFAEVAKADAILVVNDEKHGIKGYIGPNALMEMALAYWLKKPIFVLNKVGKDNNVYEEILGLGCQVLDGDLGKIAL